MKGGTTKLQNSENDHGGAYAPRGSVEIWRVLVVSYVDDHMNHYDPVAIMAQAMRLQVFRKYCVIRSFDP